MLAGMPAQYVDAFSKFYVDGDLDESGVLPTVEEITSRAPGTSAQWARALLMRSDEADRSQERAWPARS